MRNSFSYETQGHVHVTREQEELDAPTALNEVVSRIDTRRGAIFASGYEDPGRYTRWDIGFVDPPIMITSHGRAFSIQALSDRGRVMLTMIKVAVERCDHVERFQVSETEITGAVQAMPAIFLEEDRSRQPSIFSLLRSIAKFFGSDEDAHLGLYGALGYDLVFQFEQIQLKHERSQGQHDLCLLLPDELVVVDHRMEKAFRYQYVFRFRSFSTFGKRGGGEEFPVVRGERGEVCCDHAPREFAQKVRQIIDGARQGDFFEVVPSQQFSAGYPGTPCELFETIRRMNPSPYEFLINLGSQQLVGASPEMFVRVDGNMVETCPISGTIRRGATPVEDAEQMLALLNSGKDRQELTMCTDVDRNDKSRVCIPGSVYIKGHRLLEWYATLIHTVDHAVGLLRDDRDGFDALLSHMWACTLTGAPKPAAMQMIEDLENSPRGWYGGCVGMLRFNGSINTGITIRTVKLQAGIATVRAGATVLVHSAPDEEERETRLKAEAFLNAIMGKPTNNHQLFVVPQTGAGKRILFVDCKDSFVFTLGNYVRQTGAEVLTVRHDRALEMLKKQEFDLVFISPGPGRPKDFRVPSLILWCAQHNIPVFGVCLGLQGMVEAFGGELGILSHPAHGESAEITCWQKAMFSGFPRTFRAGRYHSLYVRVCELPRCFELLAFMEVGAEPVVMAIKHQDLPLAAVQFHPESLLSLKDDLGLRLISQMVGMLCGATEQEVAA